MQGLGTWKTPWEMLVGAIYQLNIKVWVFVKLPVREEVGQCVGAGARIDNSQGSPT